MREIASYDTSLNYGLEKSTSEYLILAYNISILLAINGGSPLNKTYIMQPNDHSSHSNE